MKRRALALTTLLALIAIGGGSAGYGPAAPPAAPAGERPVFRVGLVTDVRGLNDRGYNRMAFAGVKRATAKLQISYRVLQPRTNADYVTTLSSLAQERYDLIIAVGFRMGAAVDAVATRFKDRRFAIVDVDQTSLKDRPINVLGILFNEQEAGYLAGYLGALTERSRPGRHVMGSVGGQKLPPIDRFIAGFQAGAKAADRNVILFNDYSQDFVDQSKCRQLALAQIARGAHVVFQVAAGCGLGALDAAKERGVWGIGADFDQSFLGPHILTSALKRVDVAVFDTVKATKAGKFRGNRNVVLGLRHRCVGLGRISSRVPRKLIAQLQAVQRRIAAGKIRIPTTVR